MERGRESNPHGQLGQREIIVIDAGLGFDRRPGVPSLAGDAVCQPVCHRGAFTVIRTHALMTASAV
jgi:hypothetical protein